MSHMSSQGAGAVLTIDLGAIVANWQGLPVSYTHLTLPTSDLV